MCGGSANVSRGPTTGDGAGQIEIQKTMQEVTESDILCMILSVFCRIQEPVCGAFQIPVPYYSALSCGAGFIVRVYLVDPTNRGSRCSVYRGIYRVYIGVSTWVYLGVYIYIGL